MNEDQLDDGGIGGDHNQLDNQQVSTELQGDSANSAQNQGLQDSPTKSARDANDISLGQESDNYAGFGYADMTSLAKLSD